MAERFKKRTMTHIHIFSADLIQKIAAGEVILNPASVVKELIENAIDAQAKKITIQLTDAGMSRIQVHDDGIGLSKADLALAWHNHASSKLQSLSDLDNIRSLGFRGEALASIAAVSHLSIQSRPAQPARDFGWQIHNDPAEMQKIGMPIGTMVQVDQLFFNMPARKKFLHSANYELRQVVEVVETLALGYPDIRFQLIHHEKTLFLFSATSQSQRIKEVLGKNFLENSLPLSFTAAHFSGHAFFAKPQLANEKTTRQYIFINRRFIKNKDLVATIKKAYGSLIPKTAQPSFILMLEVPADTLDINIHPRKTEVKIFHLSEIQQSLLQQLQNLFAENNLIYRHDEGFLYPKDVPSASKKLHLAEHLNMQATSELLKAQKKPWSVKSDAAAKKEILQIGRLYLLYESEAGLMLVDQHAAHERILYEEFLTQYADPKNFTPTILEPPLLLEPEISHAERLALQEFLPALQKVGFSFQENPFYLTHIPQILQNRQDLVTIIREFLHELETQPMPSLLDNLSQRVIFYLACRSSIKANEYLTQEERWRLIHKLAECKNPYTCPHGRPTQVLVSAQNIAQLFHR